MPIATTTRKKLTGSTAGEVAESGNDGAVCRRGHGERETAIVATASKQVAGSTAGEVAASGNDGAAYRRSPRERDRDRG